MHEKRGERKHGLSTEQFPVSAYIGSLKNLKNLKDDPEVASKPMRSFSRAVGEPVTSLKSNSTPGKGAKGSMAFLQNNFRCPPILGA